MIKCRSVLWPPHIAPTTQPLYPARPRCLPTVNTRRRSMLASSRASPPGLQQFSSVAWLCPRRPGAPGHQPCCSHGPAQSGCLVHPGLALPEVEPTCPTSPGSGPPRSLTGPCSASRCLGLLSSTPTQQPTPTHVLRGKPGQQGRAPQEEAPPAPAPLCSNPPSRLTRQASHSREGPRPSTRSRWLLGSKHLEG